MHSPIPEIVDDFGLSEEERIPLAPVMPGVSAETREPELCAVLDGGVVDTSAYTSGSGGQESAVPCFSVWEPGFDADAAGGGCADVDDETADGVCYVGLGCWAAAGGDCQREGDRCVVLVVPDAVYAGIWEVECIAGAGGIGCGGGSGCSNYGYRLGEDLHVSTIVQVD